TGPSHSHRRIGSAVESGAGAVWQRARFGTVRPRVQIPGPRPILNSESSSSAIQRARGGHWGSQGDHKFLGEHGASSPFEVVPGPLLNSGIVISGRYISRRTAPGPCVSWL